MTRLDRYLLGNFLRIFLISLISLTGMFVVIHLFTNLDELMEMVTADRSLMKVAIDFYGPRSLDFFDRTVAVLLLMSGIFSLALMQRRQEMTAIEAAGIPKLRLLRPIVFASIVLIAISVVNREMVIPGFRESLISTAQNWREAPEDLPPNFHKDHALGLLISVADVSKEKGTMLKPVVQLPIHLSRRVSRISGLTATWLAGNANRPAGLLINKVTDFEKLQNESDLSVGTRKTIYFAATNKWLQPHQVYVATTLNLEELAYGRQMTDYTSLPDMIATLRRPSQWYSQNFRIAVHSRIVRPLLDLSLLLVALPIVLTQSSRNLFLASMTCVGIMGLFSLTVLGSQMLGSLSLVRPPALSAWLPVIVFLPLSVLTTRLMLK